MGAMINAPVYVDAVLAVVLLIAAVAQFFWLAMHGSSIGRWLQGIGFCGVSVRILWTLFSGGDPNIASFSIPFLAAIGCGAAITAIQQMRMLRLEVKCMQDPSQQCFRSDRVKVAILERRGRSA